MASSFQNCCGRVGRPPRRWASGFTLIELLVVIAIVAILASIVAPALLTGKERSKRTACLNHIRQFNTVLHLYGIDFNEWFPPGLSEMGEADRASRIPMPGPVHEEDLYDQHLPVLARNVFTNMIVFTKAPRIFNCPNLREPFTAPGGCVYPGYGRVLGYNYIAGHLQTPWPMLPYPRTTWISAQRLSDSPTLPMLSDLNTFTYGEVGAIVPHTARGFEYVGRPGLGVEPTIPGPAKILLPDDLHPKKYGGIGGNVAYLDGSAIWKPMRKLTVYRASSTYDSAGAYSMW